MEQPENSRATSEAGYCFHGGYERAVDPKGRFNLPFRLRRNGEKAGTERYIVIKGQDGQLNLMPEDVYEAAFDRLRAGEPGREKRNVLRKVSGGSRPLEPDAQGRVAIAAELLALVGITKRITVIGMGDYMELWDPDRLAIIDDALGAPDAKLMDSFFG